MGAIGQNECPEGYEPIYFNNTCQLAATILGLNFNAGNSDGEADSVCYTCGGCNPEETRVRKDYGSFAKWVCQISGFATGGNLITFSNSNSKVGII